jgi:hypothetical protein
MTKIALILISVGTTLAQQSDAPPPPRHYTLAYVSAEVYKDMPLEWRTGYISGWVDTHLNGSYHGNAKAVQAFRECMEFDDANNRPQGGKNINQITAIVDKYVNGHPESWRRPATLEADAALRNVCPSLQELFETPFICRPIPVFKEQPKK